MNFDTLIRTMPIWQNGADDEDGIVISSRARLARNIRDKPFATKISDVERDVVIEQVLAAAKSSSQMENSTFYSMSTLDGNDRRVLVERHLISPALADGNGQRGVLFNEEESLSVMINEEDHLRLQAIFPGISASSAWKEVNALDDELSFSLPYSYSNELGFLTACPTNTGTGLRVSVFMHLPGLVLTEDMERVVQGLSQLSFTVRGVYGEGSNPAGNLFQVSNQSTLGSSEEKIVEELLRVVGQIVAYERNARETLLEGARSQTEDKVWRAHGLLSNARVLSSQEFMNLLSAVRLGYGVGLIRDVTPKFLNQLMVITQPSHMQAAAGRPLEADERDFRRAEMVRNKFSDSAAD